MTFCDDEAIKCDACGELIYAGQSYQYIKIKGMIKRCCNYEDCASKILYDIYGDDFLEVHLNTAEDKECIYGDMQED